MNSSLYSWKPGARIVAGLDPQMVGEEFNRIERQYGRVTARAVVEVSQPTDAPLHDVIFHVGQRRAAQLHYEERARDLIRSLKVRIIEAPTSVPVRARVSLVQEDGQQYYSAEAVALDPELSEAYRAIVWRRLLALKAEMLAWDEFAAIVLAIEETEARRAA